MSDAFYVELNFAFPLLRPADQNQQVLASACGHAFSLAVVTPCQSQM